MQSTEDGAKAGEEFESGNYGSAAAHVGMGMGNAALDWFPPAKFALFAGMNARTFPWLKLPIAEAMEKAGRSTDEIWRATGLERDITGHWRFEISDKGYRVNPKAGTLDADGYRVARLFEQQLHPGLREAYPGLAEAKSKILIDPMKERAWFRPGLVGFEVPIKSVLQHYGIHELQHMIDYLEKLPRGGSMAEFTKLGFSKAEAEDLYNRLVGEVVARNAQFRWRRDETYRQWNSPMSTEGMSPTSGIRIPRDRQIIRSYSDLFP